MDVDLITFSIMFGMFLVLFVGLSNVLLKPLFKVLEARYQRIEGARDDIERLRKLAAADMESYQDRMRDARDSAAEERDKLVNEGRDEERRMLADVRAEIADALNRARQEVGAAEMQARKSLSDDTNELARQLVSKVLGREVSA